MIADLGFGQPEKGHPLADSEKIIIMEELDVFGTISACGSGKSERNLTNESYSATLSTNSREHKFDFCDNPNGKENKINLIKVEILDSCSSKDSYGDHSASFFWDKKKSGEVIIPKKNINHSGVSDGQGMVNFDAFLSHDIENENLPNKKAPLAPRNKNKISFNFDKKFLKEVNQKMLSPSSQFTIHKTPIHNNEKPPELDQINFLTTQKGKCTFHPVKKIVGKRKIDQNKLELENNSGFNQNSVKNEDLTLNINRGGTSYVNNIQYGQLTLKNF